MCRLVAPLVWRSSPCSKVYSGLLSRRTDFSSSIFIERQRCPEGRFWSWWVSQWTSLIVAPWIEYHFPWPLTIPTFHALKNAYRLRLYLIKRHIIRHGQNYQNQSKAIQVHSNFFTILLASMFEASFHGIKIDSTIAQPDNRRMRTEGLFKCVTIDMEKPLDKNTSALMMKENEDKPWFVPSKYGRWL